MLPGTRTDSNTTSIDLRDQNHHLTLWVKMRGGRRRRSLFCYCRQPLDGDEDALASPLECTRVHLYTESLVQSRLNFRPEKFTNAHMHKGMYMQHCTHADTRIFMHVFFDLCRILFFFNETNYANRWKTFLSRHRRIWAKLLQSFSTTLLVL